LQLLAKVIAARRSIRGNFKNFISVFLFLFLINYFKKQHLH